MISESTQNDNSSFASDGLMSLDGLLRFAQALAVRLTQGDSVALIGPFGAGKTTFAQALCRALDVTETVTSPTFTLIHQYASGRVPVTHVDCYRLEELEEVERTLMALDEIMENRQNIVLIEWAELCPELLTMCGYVLHLDHCKEDESLRMLRFEDRKALS